MAHVLNIVYGSTTVNLTSNGIDVMNYDLNGAPGEQVTEEIELRIVGSSASDLSGKIATVQKAIEQARRYSSERIGDRVYLSLKPDGYASAYKSEVLDAMLTPFEDVLKSRSFTQKYTAGYRLVATRRAFWQGEAVQLKISNSNGTDNTAGLNVYNCNDGAGTAPTKRNNYFDVSGSLIGGDLPAAVKIEMLNSSGAAFAVGNLWIGGNDYGKYSCYDDIGDTSDATASGGKFARKELSSTWGAINGAKYPEDVYIAYGKQRIGILCRFNAKPPANTRGYAAMYLTPYKSEEFYLDTATKLQLIGIYQPRYTEAPGFIYLGCKNDWGGNLDVDYFTYIPMGNYSRVVASSARVDDACWFVYDTSLMPDPICYYDANAHPINYYPAYGTGVFLAPGKDHRLTLHWDTNTGDCEIDKYFAVKLYYYPRRRTL